MKKFRKLLSVLCAFSMIMTVSVSALAAEYPDYIPFEPTGIVTFEQLQEALEAQQHTTRIGVDTPKPVFLPYNDGGGTSGVGLCYFTADTVNFYFAMNIDSGYTGTEYDIQLWQDNPDGTHTKLGNYKTYSFGEGPVWLDALTIGTSYHVTVSSRTINVSGAECTYIWSTEDTVKI